MKWLIPVLIIFHCGSGVAKSLDASTLGCGTPVGPQLTEFLGSATDREISRLFNRCEKELDNEGKTENGFWAFWNAVLIEWGKRNSAQMKRSLALYENDIALVFRCRAKDPSLSAERCAELPYLADGGQACRDGFSSRGARTQSGSCWPIAELNYYFIDGGKACAVGFASEISKDSILCSRTQLLNDAYNYFPSNKDLNGEAP